ncbi:MAG: glucose-6-phosphate isomerase [Hyphomicrobiales bacterium]|nr:glucose-6-phosphate isomerase [Hyphomicrobiales bacterium]
MIPLVESDPGNRALSDPTAHAFARLAAHCRELENLHLRDLFDADPLRFATFSRRFDDLLVDFSKTRVTADTIDLLLDLARAADVEGWRDRMFSGERINATEGRAVLHTALRDRRGRGLVVDGRNVAADVAAVLSQIEALADAVRSGAVAGATGERFTDGVNIGIGGSGLGPKMAARALAPYRGDGPNVHFVANVDGADIGDALKDLDPARTLFVIVSKTFTTLETMANAETARNWIVAALGEAAIGDHFAAVSTNCDRVAAFGINPARMFGFWDWVGGRFSVWSAVGLALAISVGFERFSEFLDGGHDMDRHFETAPLADNLPVLMALIGVWHRDLLGHTSHAIIPYDQRLELFPAHLQQLDMESNGKRTTRDGEPVTQRTAPVLWGTPGTNGQHAFFQMLHQGTDIVPVDFLMAAEPHETLGDHHAMLLANCLAQSEALMRGLGEAEVRAELAAQGLSAADIDALAPHKVFPGNRPSITLTYRKLDPYTLGRLLALYEHITFVQGCVWRINPFDQWGVELGKKLAGEILPLIKGEGPEPSRDSSTSGLIAHLRALQDGSEN